LISRHHVLDFVAGSFSQHPENISNKTYNNLDMDCKEGMLLYMQFEYSSFVLSSMSCIAEKERIQNPTIWAG